MKIILDNGHGNNTPGKRSPIWPDGSQLFEFEFNRHIVQMVKMHLEKLGFEVVVLVPEEHDVPLVERVKRANAIYKKDKDSFLISIHANAGGGTGFEVFTSVGQTTSDLIAAHIFVAARVHLPKIKKRVDRSDGDMDKEAHFYILRNTHCPAVLTENLFMDHPEDCKILFSQEGRKKIALLHVEGIVNYIKSINDEKKA